METFKDFFSYFIYLKHSFQQRLTGVKEEISLGGQRERNNKIRIKILHKTRFEFALT